MNDTQNPYAGYRYPAEIISNAVWLYFRFTLSDRDVEELLAARGIMVTDEAIRPGCLKFGQDFANAPRRRAPRRGDQWHLDEVYLRINGQRDYLWRAADQDGDVLDIRVQPRRDQRAAQRFFRKRLKRLRDVPRVIITDPLKSHEAACKALIPGVEHRQHKGLNNRAKLSHQPTRQRERQRCRFKSPGHAQRVLSAQGPMNHLFRPRRHRMAAAEYRAVRIQAFDTGQQVTSAWKAG